MSQRNIRIAYLLTIFSSCWFWMGVWIFYYLRFTDYSGVGLLETVYIATLTLSSIPSGAVADILGKKPTIMISFLLSSGGNILMGLAPNFSFLALSLIIMTIGGALYSGTIEALVFDSLKQEKKEKLYDKIISNINSLQIITPALAGVIGGFIYTLNPGYPFFASGLTLFIAFCISILLMEPSIEAEKFSLSGFIGQSKRGWQELTKTPIITKQTLLLASIGVIVVISSEVVDSMLGIEFGYSEEQMGILWAVIMLAVAGASQLTPAISKRIPARRFVFLSGLVIAATLITSPGVGMLLGGLMLLVRSSFQAVYRNSSSILINQNTQSKYRATTLSTFTMLISIPYMFTAYFIGSLADVVSARYTAVFLGLVLVGFLGIQYLVSRRALSEAALAEARVNIVD